DSHREGAPSLYSYSKLRLRETLQGIYETSRLSATGSMLLYGVPLLMGRGEPDNAHLIVLGAIAIPASRLMYEHRQIQNTLDSIGYRGPVPTIRTSFLRELLSHTG
ncbi:hypothetical protein HYW21_00220, partial [Candidatus Woesearchaeota archaeon]|nr:hypothetical protein [Candidatus Woesearchaeota archaeon]